MTDTQETGPMFNLEKIYVKDISFENPNAPLIFTAGNVQPAVSIQLGIQHNPVSAPQENLHEVVLKVTVESKYQDKTLFLAEVVQAGVFNISGIPPTEMPLVLEIACPNVLLPYVREAISDLIGKGGFPPLLINPVNFEALYQQKLVARDAQAGVPAAAPAPVTH